MLNRRNYTIYGHDWNPMPDMEVDIWGGGGVRIFGRGVREKGGSGVRTNPPNPPWLRAWAYSKQPICQCGLTQEWLR